MLQAIFRGIARLLVGKGALESAQRIAEAKRQQRLVEQAMKKHGERADVSQADISDERQALLAEAKRTQARVDATMDDETRKKVHETATRLMKEGK
jgi:hypothetical protein